MNLECQQLPAFLAGDLSPADCGRFEEHVALCEACTQQIDAQSAMCKDAIDSRIRSADSRIELPSQFAIRIQQVLVNQEHSVQGAPTKSHARGIFSIVLVASLCATLLGGHYLVIHRSVMPVEPQIEHTANSLSRSESHLDSFTENTIRLETEPAPESSGFRAALIARQGFFVAEHTDPDDEIPFYWVLPMASSKPKNDSTDNNSL